MKLPGPLWKKVLAPLSNHQLTVISHIFGESWVIFIDHTKGWLPPDLLYQEITNCKWNLSEKTKSSAVNVTQHFRKKKKKEQSNMVAVVSWSGAALPTQDLDYLLWVMKVMQILLCTRAFWGRVFGHQLWSQTEVHFVSASGQWTKSHQQVNLWTAQNSKMKDLEWLDWNRDLNPTEVL